MRPAPPLLLCFALLAGCGEEGAVSLLVSHTDEPIVIEPLEVGPVSFFNDSCARCHGEFGWSYAEGFTEKYTRDELKEVVHEMVNGPSQQTIDERSLEALTDLHYAFDAGDEGLFIAVTELGDVLRGEGLPGTLLEAAHGFGRSGGERTFTDVTSEGTWGISNWNGASPDTIWSARIEDKANIKIESKDNRSRPVVSDAFVSLVDTSIRSGRRRIHTNHGAWVALGPSGRVFGEVDSGEVEAAR